MNKQLDEEQIDKLKRNWINQRGSFDLAGTLGTENRREELLAFEKEQRARWAQQDWAEAHKLETLIKSGTGETGQSISRFKTTLGHVYIQTVWKGPALSSSMVFVPDIVIESEPENPAWQK